MEHPKVFNSTKENHRNEKKKVILKNDISKCGVGASEEHWHGRPGWGENEVCGLVFTASDSQESCIGARVDLAEVGFSPAVRKADFHACVAWKSYTHRRHTHSSL